MTKLSYILAGICCALFLWVCISWVDVIADNLEPEPSHSDYNFFVVLTTLWEDESI